jgi:type III secretory pathway component EscS
LKIGGWKVEKSGKSIILGFLLFIIFYCIDMRGSNIISTIGFIIFCASIFNHINISNKTISYSIRLLCILIGLLVFYMRFGFDILSMILMTLILLRINK